jgi:hypothetical protein
MLAIPAGRQESVEVAVRKRFAEDVARVLLGDGRAPDGSEKDACSRLKSTGSASDRVAPDERHVEVGYDGVKRLPFQGGQRISWIRESADCVAVELEQVS